MSTVSHSSFDNSLWILLPVIQKLSIAFRDPLRLDVTYGQQRLKLLLNSPSEDLATPNFSDFDGVLIMILNNLPQALSTNVKFSIYYFSDNLF